MSTGADVLRDEVLTVIRDSSEALSQEDVAKILHERKLPFDRSELRYVLLSLVNDHEVEWLPDRRFLRRPKS